MFKSRAEFAQKSNILKLYHFYFVMHLGELFLKAYKSVHLLFFNKGGRSNNICLCIALSLVIIPSFHNFLQKDLFKCSFSELKHFFKLRE